MEKTNRGMNVLVVFLLIVIIGLSVFIVYDKALKENNINDEKDNTEVTKPIVEELDVNSDFVQELYSKVFYLESSFEGDLFSDNIKFALAKNLLKDTDIQKIKCSQLSSDFKKQANATYCGEDNVSTIAISYDVLLKYAKEIYGNDVALNKNTVVDAYGIQQYIYNSDMNSFVLFNSNGGGVDAFEASYSLSSATKEDNKVYIIEDEKITDRENDKVTTKKYKYTFELEKETGNYIIKSREEVK